MSGLKRLIHEIHRRSLWQVLSVYLISSWVTLQVADTVTAALGLPDWVPQAALVLLIVLLPVVLATAFVQEGVGGGAVRAEPAPEVEKAKGEPTPEVLAPEPRGAHHRVFTWRNAMVAAAAMLALLTVSASGYMGLRAAGIGPFATLMSKGVLEERDRIVLADFENHTSDSLLAMAATELFRTALSQSLVVNVADQEYVAGVLRRMEKEPGTALDYDVAREVAIRKGLKAVVAGEIISVGEGYVVSARLVSAAEAGEELWADSETARDSEALFDAIDRLSKRLRERVGESLRTIRPSEPLAEVTTSSLEALKKFSQAERTLFVEGDVTTGVRLAEEAVQLDTLFTRGYQRLGVALWYSGAPRSKWFGAWQKAFELRDRLPDHERYSLEGFYYRWGTEEFDKALAAYRARLAIDPDYVDGNLGSVYSGLLDFERAEAMFRRVLEEDSLDSATFHNLALAQVAQGKLEETHLTIQRFGELLPDHPTQMEVAARFAAMQGDYDEAKAHLVAQRERWKDDPYTLADTGVWLAVLAILRGQLAEAEGHLAEVTHIQEEQGWTVGLITPITIASLWGSIDRWFTGDTVAALRRMEAALGYRPLDSIPLAERPYNWLIEFYAWAGEPEQAKVYLAGLEAQSESMGYRSHEGWRRYSLGMIAMIEGRSHEAISEFGRVHELLNCTMCAFGNIALSYDQATDPDSALAYYERYVTTPWLYRMWYDSMWLALAYERLGDLYEQRGDTAKAIYYYGKLVELWKDADPELQPRVEAARRAIEALSPDT